MTKFIKSNRADVSHPINLEHVVAIKKDKFLLSFEYQACAVIDSVTIT